MEEQKIARLKSVTTFEDLIEYLRDELYWPIEVTDAEEITFEYEPEELNIPEEHAVKIKSIKQVRPLTDEQPWGIFYIEFEPKKLPVTVLRKILRALIQKKRQRQDKRKTWDLHDLIFISSTGEADDRKISFAHFTEKEQGLPELRTFSWDKDDRKLKYWGNVLELEKLRWPTDPTDEEQWRQQWSAAFTTKHRYVIRTAQQLAEKMAHLAAQIREKVKEVYAYEADDGPMHTLFQNFKKVLFHDLDVDRFADMYAQTITYGLFSAKATHEEKFADEDEKDIAAIIPNTNPFLQNLFEECTKIGSVNEYGLDLDELGVTELIKTLKETNIDVVLWDFGRQQKREDPVIHFYEEFLKEYNPDQKIERGIFYTPDPVVSFIVRSVDQILQRDFDCPDGLADTSKTSVQYKRRAKRGNKLVEDEKETFKVQILDPAVGTGTFLKYVIEEVKKTFDEKHKHLDEKELNNKWNEYVSNNLLPRLYGFELQMAPYAVGHLKLGLELVETGYNFASGEGLRLYLTNTLEGTHEGAGTLAAYYDWLAREARKANLVKAKSPINVVIGNPPYRGHSANKTKWLRDLLRGKISDGSRKANYFEVDGEPLGEKNPKWLNDDYVKFIRFGQWRIDNTGEGILAFITNHAYIDNPTFRGMRQQLMASFSDIYILNLHGNIKKKEKCPDGSEDENVFQIQQGVAIGIFIKKSGENKEATVHHADLWGAKERKYRKLFSNDLTSIKWEKFTPKLPFYLFVPRDDELASEFEKYPSLSDIFNEYTIAIQTHRDDFVIDFDKKRLENKFRLFTNPAVSDEEVKEKLNLRETSSWTIRSARENLKKDCQNLTKHIMRILFRPFDIRWIFYNDFVVDRSRKKIMQNMDYENVALLFVKQYAYDIDEYSYAFATNLISDSRVFISNKGAAYHAPLYIYYKNENNDVLKTANIDSNILKKLKNMFGTQPSPEKIFYYIYGILHSKTYRDRYEALLEIDYPHIPFTSNYKIFNKLASLGKSIVSIHLMKPEYFEEDSITNFTGQGNNVIGNSKAVGRNYNEEENRLYINRDGQYFGNITPEIWNFNIGGYQVLDKWLKDRSGNNLTEVEINHFCNIVTAIHKTIEIQKEIDKVIQEHGGWPIE